MNQSMDSNNFDEALNSIHDRRWQNESHQHQLERRIMNDYRSARQSGLIRTHPVLTIVLALLLLAGTVYAAGRLLLVSRYDITVSQDGEVLTRPSVLVEEGQQATIVIQDGDATHRLEIGADGAVQYEGVDDADIDIEVHEVEVNSDHE